MAALDQHPDQAIAIARLALEDFQAGQAAVLAGDRTEGGQPSAMLQALAQTPASDPIAVDTSLNSVTMEEAIITALENGPVTYDSQANTAAPVAIIAPKDKQTVVDSATSPKTNELELTQPPENTGITGSDIDPDAVASIQTETVIETETGTVTEAVTEADIEDSEALSELPVPSIQRLFQWVRKSVQISTGQTDDTEVSAADLPTNVAGSVQGPPQQQPVDNPTVDTTTEAQDAMLDVLGEGDTDLSQTDNLTNNTVTGITDTRSEEETIDADKIELGEIDEDEVEVLFPSQPYDEDDSEALLENIWGSIAAWQDSEEDTQSQSQPPAPLSVSSPAVKPELPPQSPDSDPEVLKLNDVTSPPQAQTSVQQTTPLQQKGVMPAAPTVRIQIEHLDQLNYAVGELLTNHNQQSLQAEQIQVAMRRLYARLQQHQNLLNQLQDWIDYPPVQLDGAQNGNSTHHNSSVPTFSAIPSPFQVTSLKSDHASDPPDPLPVGFDTLELEQYSEPQLVIQSLLDDTIQLTEAVDAVELYTRQSRQTQEKQGRLLLKTRDALIEGRMFPLGQLFERFPRVLQQLETLHHKPVELTLQGTDVLVDKAIGERLYDPILHLVRNAFDHGIEPLEVRQALAKPEVGQLAIAAYHQSKHLVIEIRDDGQGLDFGHIRQRAIECQLVAPEQASRLSEVQLTDFLFEPGFSTAAQISSLSGRGVGLDVVRNQIQALQGQVTVTSVAQQGTTFTLHIPLSLTIAKLLLCQAGNRTYALLPDAIEQILIPQPEKIQQREHCKALWWGEGEETCLIPIYTLSKLLNYAEQAQQLITQSGASAVAPTAMSYVLLIRHQGVLLGLEVDQMLSEQELVIRPLNPLLETHTYIYGASILADGQLTLVLDGATLAKTASEQQTQQPPAYGTDAFAENQDVLAGPQPSSETPNPETSTKSGQKLLVIDDSITTRQTLTLTLQKVGYQVIQAQDGREAVDQLLQHPNVQLVICDVEMPRMNGFEFLQHCQHDPALAEVPVMMLSSRSSDKHRLLAEQLGAIAYISKPYLEHKLLEMVAELLKVDVLNPVSG